MEETDQRTVNGYWDNLLDPDVPGTTGERVRHADL